MSDLFRNHIVGFSHEAAHIFFIVQVKVKQRSDHLKVWTVAFMRILFN